MNSMMFMREDGQMGTCRICGKNFGLIGGYMEEFTGERLNVCVDCIKKFRQISEEDSSRVRTIVDDLISSCNNEKTLPILKKYKAKAVAAGTYKVGKDIDPGEYIAYGLHSTAQIKQFNSLDEQEDTEEIDGLFIDLTLEENQYIEVESGIILPKSTFDMNNLAQYGIYKVGQDIEAGEYKVASISDSYESSYEEVDGALGALEVADEALGGNVLKTVDLYDGQKYVTLKDGQYVRVVDAVLYKN